MSRDKNDNKTHSSPSLSFFISCHGIHLGELRLVAVQCLPGTIVKRQTPTIVMMLFSIVCLPPYEDTLIVPGLHCQLQWGSGADRTFVTHFFVLIYVHTLFTDHTQIHRLLINHCLCWGHRRTPPADLSCPVLTGCNCWTSLVLLPGSSCKVETLRPDDQCSGGHTAGWCG